MKDICISYVTGTRYATPGKGKSMHRQSMKILSWSYNQLAPEIKNEVDWIKENVPHSTIINIGERGFDINSPLRDADLIHFAGHVRINYKDAMNTSMGSPIQEERAFELAELLHLRISSRLVFINGCESGKGIKNRGDGELSPGLFFLLAGADGVIEHHWKAPDMSSAFLSRRFYSEYPDKEPAMALHIAKRHYLTKCQPGLDHPHYWSGMVYAGPLLIVQFQIGTMLLMVVILLLLCWAIWSWFYKKSG
jgi:CHAT domain-containing protein